MKRITLATVRLDLSEAGVTIKRTRYEDFRVNLAGGSEAQAYYTDDLEDAWSTGLEMAAWSMKQNGKLAALLSDRK